ncbi:hypothetical protein OAI92_02920 [Candidatus Pelagibacter sp.]|nr:hypothetical protein [Candidatus Pelagibacter sp.]
MKKLLGIVVLGLLFSGNAYADEKFVLPKIELVGDKISNSINAHVQAGFNIVDVSATDKIVVYTLRKKKTIKVCYLILTTNNVLDCVYP